MPSVLTEISFLTTHEKAAHPPTDADCDRTDDGCWSRFSRINASRNRPAPWSPTITTSVPSLTSFSAGVLAKLRFKR